MSPLIENAIGALIAIAFFTAIAAWDYHDWRKLEREKRARQRAEDEAARLRNAASSLDAAPPMFCTRGWRHCRDHYAPPTL